MTVPVGPGGPFLVLFDRGVETGLSLPEPFRAIYGGDWALPERQDRPYVYVNFAISHDGRISFAEPGYTAAAYVTQQNVHDRWLMGLLRARADAVLVGDRTFRLSPAHLWTPAYIFPPDAAAFAALRRAEARSAEPLLVVLSHDGDLPVETETCRRGLPLVVATTAQGQRTCRALPWPPGVEIFALGDEGVDVVGLLGLLARRFGVRTLLCEGGARVYGSLVRAGCVDDEFLTLCPIVIGDRAEARTRPSLVEGVAFMPQTAPRLALWSVRRAGDYLFLRSRYAAGSPPSLTSAPAR